MPLIMIFITITRSARMFYAETPANPSMRLTDRATIVLLYALVVTINDGSDDDVLCICTITIIVIIIVIIIIIITWTPGPGPGGYDR